MRWPSAGRPSPGWPSPRAAIAGAVAAVVVIGAGAGGWLWSSAAQRRATEAYAAALTRAEASRAAQAPPEAKAAAARELEALLARYPSSPAVGRAAMELGHLRYDARQYPQARAAYEVALTRSAGPTLRSLARLSIASTWEAEPDWPKAIDAYRAALAGRGPKDFMYEAAMLDLARVQSLAGRPAEATEVYRQLLKELPGTRYADEVKSRLADLSSAPAK